MLELGVFGALIILLLGILLSYGLRYNFQQRIIQQAFRKSMAAAVAGRSDGAPAQVSYLAIRDEYVPDPADPFAVGTVAPVASSSSVTSTYRMYDSPSEVSELPHVVIDVNNTPVSLLAAGFRTVGVSPGCDENNMALRKYREIYGAGNVYCVPNSSLALQITDPLYGQVPDYATARRICDMLSDKNKCTTECLKARIQSDATQDYECGTICAADTPMSGVKDICDNLNTVFAVVNGKPTRTMGLQPNYTQVTENKNVLTRSESPSGVATSDAINLESTISRTINTKEAGSSSATASYTVKSEVKQNTTTQLEAGW